MSDGVVTTDRDARVSFLNAAADRMAGVAFDAAHGQAWRDALGLRRTDGRALDDDTDPVVEVLRTERPTERDLIIWRPNGQEIAITLSAAPVRRAGGQVVGVVTVLRDVTRQRELERFEREFVALVSHELRTPLTSIFGFAELLLARELLGERARIFIETIYREAQRLTEIVGDFLDLEKLESGRISYHPRSLSLADVVSTLELTLTPQLGRHRLVVDLAPDAIAVHADRDRLDQVLLNVLSNAIKYSPEGGDIHVRSRLAGSNVVVSVTDSGLGLPPEAIPRLFAKFYRVEHAAHRAIRGTGLGLAICRQVVEGWGGKIRAESRGLGRGSTFSFTLPPAMASLEVTDGVDELFHAKAARDSERGGVVPGVAVERDLSA